jgi:putative transposase
MWNHYHLLVEGSECARVRETLGLLHGRSSREWNLEENTTGRKVWYRVFDRPVYSQRQFNCTLNYIHYNPVKDGFCRKMSEWKWSGFNEYLSAVGRAKAMEIWRTYPPSGSSLKE